MTSQPLGPEWERPFSVREAREAGVSASRLRAVDLRHEFRGSRVPRSLPNDLLTRCAALQLNLDGRHVFSGVTAARLWGMPLPQRLEASSNLCVASIEPARAIRRRGVSASERPAAWPVTEIGGVRVHEPVPARMSLVRVLELWDLVAAGEFIVTPPSSRTPALAALPQLCDFVGRARGSVGISRARAATTLIEVGAKSRPESLLRFLLTQCGLPPARINETYVLRTGREVAPDLSWPEFLVAVEYDGGYHFEPGQFARDLIRTDELVDEGWLVVHVVAAQLYARPAEVVARVIQRLASRGAPTRSVSVDAHFEP